MKRYELVAISDYIRRFDKIDRVFRVDDTVVKMEFDRVSSIFFDLKKGESYVFKNDDYKVSKLYSAPFDVVLKKRCDSSHINGVKVLENNKVLRFELEQKKSYKAIKTILQLEFTGRHTNFIITDENLTILEALRHIDASTSYRVIQNGMKLPDLPPFSINEKEQKIENIEEFLYKEFQKKEQKRLQIAINQKLLETQKKIDKLQKIKESLKQPKELLDKSQTYKKSAELILSNLHLIKPYQKEIEVFDFEGNKRKITLPAESKTPSQAADMLYKESKRLKKKSQRVHIETENLNSKIKYLQNLQNIIKDVKSVDELKLYFPKKEKSKKREKSFDGVEEFFLKGYKISLGKNEKANEYLLKNSKSNDIWLHLKDIPSTHVIIKNDKKELPPDILEFAAKLCVRFSTTQKDSYLVDYTRRRDVKIIQGAKVNYFNYKTLKVKF